MSYIKKDIYPLNYTLFSPAPNDATYCILLSRVISELNFNSVPGVEIKSCWGAYPDANYADGNTPYVFGKNIDEVVRSSEESSHVIFKWFSDNQFQATASKCHVLISTDEHVQVKIGTAQIENSPSEKLLRVTIEAKLSFEKDIKQIYAKARAKLKALARVAPFMNIKKRKY